MHLKSAAQPAAVGSSVIRQLRGHIAWLTACCPASCADRCFPPFSPRAREPTTALSRSATTSSLLLPMPFRLVLLSAMAATSLSLRLLGALHPVPVSCPRCAVIASDAADPSMSGDPAAEAEAKELMRQYAELQAAQAAQGSGAPVAAGGSVAVGAAAARWRENEKEVSLWISVDGELRARDVKVGFGSRSLSLEIAGDTLLKGKALLGKVEPDESWWAFDDADAGLDVVLDEVPEGAKALQLVLAKADNAVWAGVFDKT